MAVNNFDVMKLMGERNLDIQLAPLGNVLRVHKVKAGTQVTIGVGGDVVAGIADGRFVGGLILADQEQFHRLKQEMEAEDAA